jgi:sortase A
VSQTTLPRVLRRSKPEAPSVAPATAPAPPRAPKAQRPPGEVEEAVSLVSSAFTMAAILSLWFVLQAVLLGGISEARAQHLLYAQFRTELAAATAPTGPVVKPGRPVALVTVPKLGAMQVVVEGTGSGDLLAGPGHRRDTVLPGQQGVSLVYSRGSTYGAPFAGIGELQVGDQVISTTGQGRVVYKIVDIRRAGDALRPFPTGTTSRLTITTTEGSGPLSGLRASSVVYVDAEAPKGLPAPTGRPAQVPKSEQAMATDRGALPVLVLALALLVACTLAISAARRRWSAALVWVVATPVALALAWFTTDTVMRLLPNLL